MAQDVRLEPDEDGLYHLVIDEEAADFQSVDGLETSQVVSLFTDGRADESNVLAPKNRRGWIGDINTAETGRQIGSLLWTLDQARLNQETVNNAKIFAINALQWFVEDNVAKSTIVSVVRTLSSITISVDFTTTTGETKRYEYLWRNTNVSNIANA